MPRILPRAPNEDELEAIPDSDLEDKGIAGVVERFAEISTKARRFVAHFSDPDLKSVRYTTSRRNNRGFQNHIQGLQRLKRSPFLVMSGGNWRKSDAAAHLFVVWMGSRSGDGPWLSNIALPQSDSPYDLDPPASDAVRGFVSVDPVLWHAGGLDRCGHVLAIPIECGAKGGVVRPPKCESGGAERKGTSRIEFLFMRDPLKPLHLPCTIERHDLKATSAGLVRLGHGGRYVALVTRAGENGRRLEFYLSTSTKIWEGWGEPSHIELPEDEFGGYQTTNLIRPTDAAGRLYLVGLENTSMAPPDIDGDDRVDLYQISFDPPADTDAKLVVGSAVRKARLNFGENDEWANMAAGAGVYQQGGRLVVYSTYQYRDKRRIGFLQYS